MKKFSQYQNQQQVDEGLSNIFNWFKKLWNKIFDDDTSKETKNYVGTTLRYISDDNNKIKEQSEKILQIKDANDLIKALDESGEQLIKDGTKEEDVIKFKLGILSSSIRIANDSKDQQKVKILKGAFDKLVEEQKDVAEQMSKDLKSEESKTNNDSESKDNNKDDENNKKEEEQTNDENKNKDDEKLLEVYKSHEDIIETLSKKLNIKLDDIKDTLVKYSNENEITDPLAFYGLILVKLGSSISNKSDEYIKNICGNENENV